MRYNSYSSYFKNHFGHRMQKLSIDAGFSCPNRAPRPSHGDPLPPPGGCIFCNNAAFTPSYCQPRKSITQQIDEGIEFHSKRYSKARGYLAYFQSYSNTFAPLPILRERYEEALSHPLIDGIVIATRPDCIDQAKLDYIASLAQDHYVSLEYGIESCYDATLLRINRGHHFATTQWAIRATAQRGIHCGGHLILGLPGDSPQAILHQADILSQLPLNSLKLHQLQILKGTVLEQQYLHPSPLTSHPSPLTLHQFSLPEYITLLCDFLERLRPDIVVERLAGEVPPRFQADPSHCWLRPDGRPLRYEEIPPLVNAELTRRNTRQGHLCTHLSPQ